MSRTAWRAFAVPARWRRRFAALLVVAMLGVVASCRIADDPAPEITPPPLAPAAGTSLSPASNPVPTDLALAGYRLTRGGLARYAAARAGLRNIADDAPEALEGLEDETCETPPAEYAAIMAAVEGVPQVRAALLRAAFPPGDFVLFQFSLIGAVTAYEAGHGADRLVPDWVSPENVLFVQRHWDEVQQARGA